MTSTEELRTGGYAVNLLQSLFDKSDAYSDVTIRIAPDDVSGSGRR